MRCGKPIRLFDCLDRRPPDFHRSTFGPTDWVGRYPITRDESLSVMVADMMG